MSAYRPGASTARSRGRRRGLIGGTKPNLLLHIHMHVIRARRRLGAHAGDGKAYGHGTCLFERQRSGHRVAFLQGGGRIQEHEMEAARL